MIVYKDYTIYDVLGLKVNLISDEICNSQNTVAEIDDVYYYLGNETPNILAAVLAWEEFTGKNLSEDELHQVMVTNNLISGAI